MSFPELLDPHEPAHRPALRAWLQVQARFAYAPEEARARLEMPAGEAGLVRAAAGSLSSRALDALCLGWQRAGLRLLAWPSPAYPEPLRALRDAPAALGVRGDARALSAPAVALVGPRAPTVYGLHVAERLAGELAAAGLVVVSGLARGVDAAAHRAALAVGGVSVAVLGCGPDRVYPAAHRRLAARLAEQGAVVSELPLGTPPRPAHFPLRNRVISGLCRAVVVVEARQRSGSLITARHALEQGREVLAVPGPVDAPASRGANLLLRDGAAPALDASDVLRAIGMQAPAGTPGARARGAPTREAPGASLLLAPGASLRLAPGAFPVPAPGASPVLEALAREPLTRDELGRRLGMSPQDLAAELLALEMAGRVVEERDGRLRCTQLR